MTIRILLSALYVLLCTASLPAQRWGEPIPLFNGRDLGGWRMRTAHAANWTVANGELVNLRAGSNLVTAALFKDFKLHLEFNCPPHSNSGVYLRGRYEVQITSEPGVSALDRTGAIYNVLPAAGPEAPAGEWASLDIELVGRTVTVALNGQTLIDRRQITKLTGGALDNRENEPGPVFLQGDHGPIRFRNILLTPALDNHGRFERTWETVPAPALPVNAAEQMLDPEFRRRPESRSAGLLQLKMEEDPGLVDQFEFAAGIRASDGVKAPRVIVNGRSTYFFPESGPAPRLTLRPRDLVTGLNALQFTCDQKGASPGRFLVERAALIAALNPAHPDLARHRLAGCEYTIRPEPGPLALDATPDCLARVAKVAYQPAVPTPGAQVRARISFRSVPGIEYVTAPRFHPTTVRVQLPDAPTPLVRAAAGIFARRLKRLSPSTRLVESGPADFTLHLEVRAAAGAEGFRIATEQANAVRITGHDERGLIYGVGRFLHTSRFAAEGFTPSAWRGSSVPAASLRGIYFASHFNNFYEVAPLNELQDYIEDLALWGVNAIVLAFPQWQYDSFEDPAARANLDRIRQMMQVARSAGMQVGLLTAENQGFHGAPAEILSKPYPDPLHRRGTLGVNICPSHPEGRAYLLKCWGRLLDEFRSTGLDLVGYWPYDEGGCGCQRCWPWGSRGHLELSRAFSELALQRFPGCRFILSTWMFDTPPAGEWEGLTAALAASPRPFNYIMADAHEDFPRYPLDRGVPGKLPLINFPEISMWGISPWGGYGASPMPSRLQRLWNQTAGHIDGGFPYSEGIYEDMNKVIEARFYWDPKQTAENTVREYAAAYFSPQAAEAVAQAVAIFERNHNRNSRGRFARPPENTARALELLRTAEAGLTIQARQSWRWRLLYLRALIDDELARNGGKLEGPVLREAFSEIVRIYHAERVHTNKVAPPQMAPDRK